MKKILFILLLISFNVYSQGGGMRVKDLQTTTTGSTNDYLIKDDSAGTPGSTKKIKVSAFKTLYGVGSVTSVGATGGTGITITGSPITTSGTLTVTNTAPDQTVTIGNGTGISATGTYPTFTITNTSPDQTVTIGSGTNILVTGTYPTFTVTNTQSLSGYIPYTGATTNVNLNDKNFTGVNRIDADTLNSVALKGSLDVNGWNLNDGNTANFTSFLGTRTIVDTVHSTINMSVGSLTVAPSSILELQSTTKGLLIPRMTTTQRDAISTPSTGLTIYNTTTNTHDYYNGSSWVKIAAGTTPTFTTVTTQSLNLTGATASTYAGFDASKNLVSGSITFSTTSTATVTTLGTAPNYTFSINAAGGGGFASTTMTNTVTIAQATYPVNFNNGNFQIGSVYSGSGNGLLKLQGTGTTSVDFIELNPSTAVNSSGWSMKLCANASSYPNLKSRAGFLEMSTNNGDGGGIDLRLNGSSGRVDIFNAGTQYINLSASGNSYMNLGGGLIIGGTSVNASAILEVKSTTQGLLLPRMTTTQRDAISSPAAGLIIYNTTTGKINVYTTTWEAVTSL